MMFLKINNIIGIRIFFLYAFLFALSTQAQQLELYIQEAESANPKIQAFELRHAIAKEKVNEVNTLPNTQVSVGYFVSEPETRTGAQRAKFSVRQFLPWFGTITARENYSSAMAEAEYVAIAITKRKLALAVSQAYYDLFSVYKKQKVIDENIHLLQTYEQLALTAVEVGNASAVDVLKLQIRKNELEQRKAVLEQDFFAIQSKFNTLLNRESTIKIDITDQMNIPLKDPEISNKAVLLHPELVTYDKLYESIVQSEALNQKEGGPQIGLGLDYIPVSEREDVAFSDNGKDIIMPMVSLSIPIFNKKYNSRTLQNELQKQEITAQKEERLHQLTTMFSAAMAKRNTARIKYDTQKKNLEQAKNVEQILIKNYETGTVDFNDVLDIQELKLKFQIHQIESIQHYYTQSALINYLIN